MQTRRLALVAWLTLAGLAPVRAQDVPIQKDIVYGKAGGVELKLDLARPAKGDGPFPLVVCLHGGAWQLGQRSDQHARLRLLADHGYVAASVGYRLAPKHRFPAQVEDAKCAVRFLRAHARDFKIDPNRVAAAGDSAGGHLALLLGLMDAKDGLEGNGGSAGQPSKVQAVVNYFGPTDLRTWSATPQGEAILKAVVHGKDSNALLKDFVGTADRKAAVVAKASPITYVDAKDPPVLTFQGTADPLVPAEQAKALHEALKKAGVVEKLVLLEGAGHGWGGKVKERTDRLMLEFLDRHFKANR
jgi:acetyl esterase/lipase